MPVTNVSVIEFDHMLAFWVKYNHYMFGNPFMLMAIIHFTYCTNSILLMFEIITKYINRVWEIITKNKLVSIF